MGEATGCAVLATDKKALFEKARGALLGGAIGDALGATVEFMSPSEIRHRYGVHRRMEGGGWLYLKPGQVTDDTQMSLCVARALVETGSMDPAAVMEKFAAWYRGKPIDIGSTCLAGIRNYLVKGALSVPPAHFHAGNGAAMRMGPVALATYGSDERLCDWAVKQAHLTHNNPLSDGACLAVGRLVHLALSGAAKGAMEEGVSFLRALSPDFSYSPYSGKATGYVADTLATVLHYFFATESFEECLVGVVNRGQDADTTGAIAGVVAGAYYGFDGLPRKWLGKLDPKVREELTGLSEKLLALSPGAATSETAALF